MNKKKLQLSRETLSALSRGQITPVIGASGVESCERVYCSGDSDCRWTCGQYSECFPTVCYCYTGVYTDCGC